jgi:integrase
LISLRAAVFYRLSLARLDALTPTKECLTVSRLPDSVREALRARHYSLRTEEAYLRWIRQYILFFDKRHPPEPGAPEISAFVSHLAVAREVSASTQNQAISALLFLHREVLGVPVEWVDDVERAQRPKRLPVVLTREEARSVLGRLHCPAAVTCRTTAQAVGAGALAARGGRARRLRARLLALRPRKEVPDGRPRLVLAVHLPGVEAFG